MTYRTGAPIRGARLPETIYENEKPHEKIYSILFGIHCCIKRESIFFDLGHSSRSTRIVER